MSTSPNSQEPYSSHPDSLYRLRIAGVIPAGWEGRLGRFRVVHEEGTEPLATTTLMGAVTDQADLLGVLNTLHELRLTLLLVEAMDGESVHGVSENEEPTTTSKPK